MSGPLQADVEVLEVSRVGAYIAMTFAEPQMAARTRPGQFVAVAVGGPESAMLLRRAFSIHAARPAGSPDAGSSGTVQFVFAPHGKGTEWLAQRGAGDVLNVVGPLGRPFRPPSASTACTLVGGGYGTAPLFPLAEQLLAAGCDVSMILGAATAERLFGAELGAALGVDVTLTTDDGSAGIRGRVSDVLPDVLRRTGSTTVYACGPMAMLRAVAEVAEASGAAAQVAVEEAMACGIGVCMTCVLPVVGDDGLTRMVRSCLEGPVFDGERVRWHDVGTVPPDAVGAAAMALK